MAAAVATDAAAVTPPESQYTGSQSVQISMNGVNPQAMMKPAPGVVPGAGFYRRLGVETTGR
jgi:hypothetical protein